MPRTTLVLLLLATAALGAGPLGGPAAASAAGQRGPAGDAFYEPPVPLPGKRHGDLVWWRAAPTARTISIPGGRTQRILYRSTALDGRAIAVSGAVTVPRGRAPRGGWPVISWGHGTAGIADRCAPSRDLAGVAFPQLPFPLLSGWLKRGWAIVRSDYEGLGTPGEHPYLFGRSEGRSVLDAVRAARQLHPALSRRVVLAGHSQGGQAALFGASMAGSWTPELKVLGVNAMAPTNHLSELAPGIAALKEPGGLSAYVAMVLRSLTTNLPARNLEVQLSERGRELLPRVLEACYAELTGPAHFAPVAPAEFAREGTDIAPIQAALDEVADSENLTVRVPTRIDQGAADTTVFANLTAQLVDDYRARGTRVEYTAYRGVEHNPLLKAAARRSTAWVARRFGRR